MLSILIYPREYVVPQARRMGGGETVATDVRLGEAWYRGPVVLSWAEVIDDCRHLGHGRNVVWHEFAHQLDMLDRAIDGTPPLASREQYERWSKVMTAELDKLRSARRSGRPTLIDPYGALNEAEFFAVVTECFFDRPVPLREHPASCTICWPNSIGKIPPLGWRIIGAFDRGTACGKRRRAVSSNSIRPTVPRLLPAHVLRANGQRQRPADDTLQFGQPAVIGGQGLLVLLALREQLLLGHEQVQKRALADVVVAARHVQILLGDGQQPVDVNRHCPARFEHLLVGGLHFVADVGHFLLILGPPLIDAKLGFGNRGLQFAAVNRHVHVHAHLASQIALRGGRLPKRVVTAIDFGVGKILLAGEVDGQFFRSHSGSQCRQVGPLRDGHLAEQQHRWWIGHFGQMRRGPAGGDRRGCGAARC